MIRKIAILGAGMHPWGKWGHNFVQYGVAAAREALADAEVPWRDIAFVSGGATIRCGYPEYVAGATFAQALGWQGALLRLDRKQDASQMFREANRVFEKTDGPNTATVAAALDGLGSSLLAEGKFVEAEQVLLRSLEARERVEGPTSTRARFTLRKLVTAAEKHGNDEQAAAYQKRVAEIFRP